ncbi:ATP-binding protein [Myxococcota bacterium]
MLTDQQIEALALDMESDRVERKESFARSIRDRVAQAVCAYANDLPGYHAPGLILVGMKDNGGPSGKPITDELLRGLGALRNDGNILPLPTIVVRRVVMQGHEIAALLVAPSKDTPVRYDGRVWIRVGPRRAIASRDEERILTEKRQASDLGFEQHAVGGTTLDDLELSYFRSTYLPAAVTPEVIAENQRTEEHQLRALHLLSREGVPNTSALLLLGKDPREWLPSAYIQFVRFDGADMTAPIIDQKELSGRVDEMLRRAEEVAALNIRTETRVEGAVVEERRPDYPLAALQQILRNAVMHRSYEVHAPVSWYWFCDRVEIHSPGGLYGRATPENFGRSPGATDYRNQTLAAGMKVLGFVQRFGMGIPLARQRCVENGNPEPEFEFQPSAVLAVLRRRL